MKKSIALCFILLISQLLTAQNNWHYGASAALVSSTANLHDAYGFTENILNYDMGMNVAYNFHPRFQLQTGMHYIGKGFSDVRGEGILRNKVSYLQIPISMKMKFGKANFIGAGTFLEKPIFFMQTYYSRVISTDTKKLNPLSTGLLFSYSRRFYLGKEEFLEASLIGNWGLSQFLAPRYCMISTRVHSLSFQLAYYLK